MSEAELKENLPEPESIRWSGITDAGRFRKNNEDSFLGVHVDAREIHYLGKTGEASLNTGDFVFAVSDGMGGANAGEFASRIAVQKIAELMPKSFRLGAMGVDRGFSDLLNEIFISIHKEITSMSFHYEECRGMGATLSLGWFSPGWMHFCHIGDSRIYYLPKNGKMKQLTEDHTHVGWLLRRGEINEREARSHPKRNELQQVLGGRCRQILPQIGAVGVEIGDRFIFCSDGITDGVWDHRIEELVTEPLPKYVEMNPAERLVQFAMDELSKDNVTAVVVEVVE